MGASQSIRGFYAALIKYERFGYSFKSMIRKFNRRIVFVGFFSTCPNIMISVDLINGFII